MKPRSLEWVADVMGGVLSPASTNIQIATGASIDSRKISAGDLFFAIEANRDGHQFVGDALRSGAVAAVIASGRSTTEGDGPSIEVPCPRTALGVLAEAVRREESDLPAVAITGSIGKTTTCGYVAKLIGSIGPVHRPPGSFNNDLGLPLTILNAPEKTRALVLEIGTNQPGEVRSLAELTHAQIGVVTAIEAVHLEGLGDLAGVEREKLSLFSGIQENATAWVPQPYLEAARASGRSVHGFGPGGSSEVIEQGDGEFLWRLKTGRFQGDWPFQWTPNYRHQSLLLSAALAVGAQLGVEPKHMLDAVAKLPESPLRGELRRHEGVDFLLDCYNASPVSVIASIERLENEPASGRRYCVLGTMEELGPQEAQFHRELGRRVGEGSIDGVFLVGRGRSWYREGLKEVGSDGVSVDQGDRGAELIANSLLPGDRVLFKASRRESLETLAEQIATCLTDRGHR